MEQNYSKEEVATMLQGKWKTEDEAISFEISGNDIINIEGYSDDGHGTPTLSAVFVLEEVRPNSFEIRNGNLLGWNSLIVDIAPTSFVLSKKGRASADTSIPEPEDEAKYIKCV